MNGIDAVAIATGQDWRAIEASSHAWAALKGNGYKPLTRYWIEELEVSKSDTDGSQTTELVLCGELELPIPCGTRGGVLNTHPMYKFTLEIMGTSV
jgi:hydroxymethylglutaryl-CoA reductase